MRMGQVKGGRRDGRDGNLRAFGSLSLRISRQTGRKARRENRRAQSRPEIDQRPDMILMGVRDDNAQEISAPSSMKDRSGRMRSTPGSSSPAKLTPQSTSIHFFRPSGPKP